MGWNVAIESRPEEAEPNGEEIHASTTPERRFALLWAISFCPFGAGKQKNPTARGLFPISCQIYDAIFGLERRTFLMTNPNMPDKKVIAVVGSGTQVTLS